MESGFDASGRAAQARERSNGEAGSQEDKLLREEFGFSGRNTALGLRSPGCHWESAKALTSALSGTSSCRWFTRTSRSTT